MQHSTEQLPHIKIEPGSKDLFKAKVSSSRYFDLERLESFIDDCSLGPPVLASISLPPATIYNNMAKKQNNKKTSNLAQDKKKYVTTSWADAKLADKKLGDANRMPIHEFALLMKQTRKENAKQVRADSNVTSRDRNAQVSAPKINKTSVKVVPLNTPQPFNNRIIAPSEFSSAFQGMFDISKMNFDPISRFSTTPKNAALLPSPPQTPPQLAFPIPMSEFSFSAPSISSTATPSNEFPSPVVVFFDETFEPEQPVEVEHLERITDSSKVNLIPHLGFELVCFDSCVNNWVVDIEEALNQTFLALTTPVH